MQGVVPFTLLVPLQAMSGRFHSTSIVQATFQAWLQRRLESSLPTVDVTIAQVARMYVAPMPAAMSAALVQGVLSVQPSARNEQVRYRREILTSLATTLAQAMDVCVIEVTCGSTAWKVFNASSD